MGKFLHKIRRDWKMLKIFVTGDNHIGMKYATHEQKDKLISERLDALGRMVEEANNEKCGLFAITGDLFNRVKGISQKEVKAVMEALTAFHGTVVILPGNHDYFDDDAEVWQHFERYLPDNGHIALLKEFRPYKFDIGDDKVVIYPAFCQKLHSNPGENNLAWIKQTQITDDGKFHIGMAHGAVAGESLDKEGAYFQMTREELNVLPMDVWLIGHTHVPFPKDLTTNIDMTQERIFNAGTHVQTDVNNDTEGICFIIEIDEQKNIRARKFVSGKLRFCREDINVSEGKMAEQIQQKLSGLDDNSVVDIRLSGAVSEEEYEDRVQIVEKQLKRFLEKTYHFNGLTRRITEEQIKKEYPETGFAAKFLLDLLDNPKEAQMAYDLLQSVKEAK